MCSVLGCCSTRAPRFKLPEEADMRLEWVRFLARVNEQCFKESSWGDMSVCGAHFERRCFESPGRPPAKLKPGAVPSLRFQSQEPEPRHGETHEQPATSNSQSEGTRGSSDAALAVSPVHGKQVYFDLVTKKAALVRTKGKLAVNKKCLLQLLRSKCPSCGSNLKTERFAKGALVIVNPECLKCDYRMRWNSRASLRGLASMDQYFSVDAAAGKDAHTVAPEVPQTEEKQSDYPDEMDKLGGRVSMGSENYRSGDEIFKDASLHGSEGHRKGDPAHQLLCTDCGMFFSQQPPHTCLHKLKPHSCYLCGGRFVDLTSLNSHRRAHEGGREPTRLGGREHTRDTEGRLYCCSVCFKTFASRVECRVHVGGHKGVPQFKCAACWMAFQSKRNLKAHYAVHAGEKPYVCSVCHRVHQSAHMRLHAGGRPWKCRRCSETFTRDVSLNVRRRHPAGSKKGRTEAGAAVEKSLRAKDCGQKGKRGRGRNGRPKGRAKNTAAEL